MSAAFTGLKSEPNLSWEEIQLLHQIDVAGGIAGAAHLLAVDTSTVRRRLRTVEKKVGANLFEIKGTTFLPTPLCLPIINIARKMAEVSKELNHSNIDARRNVKGIVRVATMEGFASYYLAPRLAQFARQMPEINIQLVTSSRPLSLSDRETDIAINMSRPSAAGVVMRALTPFNAGLYASSDYLKRRGEPRCLEDLASHDLIGYVSDVLTVHEAGWLEELVETQELRFASSSLSGQLAAIRHGLGIGVVPAFMAASLEPGLHRILSSEANINRQWWLVTRENERNLARVRAVVDFLVAQVKSDRSLLCY